MKFKITALAILLLLCNVSFAQLIAPKDFLSLFGSVSKENAVELINTKLTGLSSKWEFIEGNKETDYFKLKWYHPANYGSNQDAEFYILTEKKADNSLINKAIYSFANLELFNAYLESVKSLDEARVVNSEKMADGSTRIVYEIKGVAFFLGSHPVSDSGDDKTYSVAMFYIK